ncbi:MAG: aldo/keto reductase [Hyphomicrobiales bacterium]|nr:aldo/keto reductase [Hyphomicrobiales bacterium]
MSEAVTGQSTAIGNTGISVPPICFGTSALGDMPATYGYEVDEERALATVRAIFDGPYPFFDTSRTYGMGRSEERIGKVIRERGGLPVGVVVSTKLDRDLDSGRFDGAQARRSLEQSLSALGLDRVDILHLHDPEYAANPDEVTAPDGSLRELMRMKEEGIAKAAGLAAGRVDVMMPLLKAWDFDALITHNRFMLTNRNAEEMVAYAAENGIAVLNAAPFAGGALAKGTADATRYVYQVADDEMLAPVRRVEEVCRRHDIPVGAAALQFSLRDPRIASTICGVSKPKRVAQTAEWATWPIPDAVWDELLALPYDAGDPEATRVYDPG